MSSYWAFLAFALVLVPGPRLRGGRQELAGYEPAQGRLQRCRVASSNAVQGAAAAAGLGAVIVGSQPLFQAIKWAGIAYLCFRGLQALRSATAAKYASLDGERDAPTGEVLVAGARASCPTSPTRRCSADRSPVVLHRTGRCSIEELTVLSDKGGGRSTAVAAGSHGLIGTLQRLLPPPRHGTSAVPGPTQLVAQALAVDSSRDTWSSPDARPEPRGCQKVN
jgi:hypothetical protein